ncbi:putative Ig domain-containing protein, partial [Spirosoma luteum]|uniref:putative Ig domain-containing protein n=1 Tax=Spirosoma luteum TaxID=431553 RepID=UPI00035F5FB4
GTINQSSGSNTATVSNIPAGVQTFTVVASDATSPTAQTISGTVSVTVTQAPPANTAPVATSNANQTATVGQAFSYTVNAFIDAETHNGLTYTASINPANGLSFNPATRVISGTPSMSGVSSVTVTATDPGNLSATTSFTITVSPAGTPPPTATFSITGVTTVSCESISAGLRRVTFNPRYAGLNGTPVSFSVVNEMLPTTNPGPYTLNLYTDNSVITLSATQSGANTLFAYNWLSACSSSTGNTPPTVANPVPPQSATVGIGYTLSLANVFTDAETPNSLVLSVTGLPAGLNFVAPSTISGTPSMSGVSTVTVTATDPGSMSASTSFTITVNPAAGTPPPPTGTFSITGVTTVSCATLSVGLRQVTFNPRYAGLNGSPVSFSVVNEMAPTTNPGPYTLNLYTDNPVITLNAVQSGVSNSFAYNWLAACGGSNPPANTPPTVANPVPPQSATVGVGYTLSLANVFTDAETPNQLTLMVSGLPAGLSFTAPSTISGTPSTSGVSTVTVTATDPGSMSASTSFTLTVNPAGGTPPPPTGTFSITGVTTVSCQVISAGQRRLTFSPRYAGLDGSPVSFSVVNELLPTTNPGPYSLDLYTDNPVINLRAVQSGVSTSFSYGWLAACNASARIATEPMPTLQVRLLGNPVVGKTVRVEVQGAESQTVWLRVQDLSGGLVDEQVIRKAASTETVELSLGTQGGVYLLHVGNGNQQRTLKVIKP